MKRFAMIALVAAGGWATGCSENSSHHGNARTDDNSRMAGSKESGKTVGAVETVAEFSGAMPTGVTVSQGRRIFVNFPRWGDNVEYTVAELKNGKPVAFPNLEINQYDAAKVAERLVSVQSVVVDPADRLWMLDTGSLHLGPVVPGGPKMIAVDLKTNQIVKTIAFPPEVALPTTYLNDVRFDLRKGKGGIAYITDSGTDGPNGIIVVDLDSGHSWRRLTGHPSVKAEPLFTPKMEGDPKVIKPLMIRPVPGAAQHTSLGADGIALSADGARLFFTPLSSRHLYSVGTDALANEQTKDEDLQKTLVDHGDRGYASDGLECDSEGRLYLTDYEHNAIHRRPMVSTGTATRGPADGTGSKTAIDTIIAQGPKMIWPDTMSIATDGYLYFTCNQLDRQKSYNEGKDLREKPYYLFRMKIDAQPVMLRK